MHDRVRKTNYEVKDQSNLKERASTNAKRREQMIERGLNKRNSNISTLLNSVIKNHLSDTISSSAQRKEQLAARKKKK